MLKFFVSSYIFFLGEQSIHDVLITFFIKRGKESTFANDHANLREFVML